MKKIILLNKKEGETPLEVLNSFRLKYKEHKNIKMTYAGRLDPMASGLLLVLTGEETKNKEKYLALEKEYNFEVLFGFATDTYDILGKVTARQPARNTTHSVAGGDLAEEISKKELNKKIKDNIKSFLGESIQKYPIYSSKTVKGKPLFMYARAGEEVDIPERKIFIKKLKLEKIREIDNKKLFKSIEKRIKKVKGPARNAKSIAFAGGDFRQAEILKIWKKNLSVKHSVFNKYFIGNFRIKCSSGTYVRGIANSLGKKMAISALAFSIKRTKIGKYVI